MRALFASLTIVVLLLAACGDDESPVAATEASTTTTSAVVPPTTAPPDNAQGRLDAAQDRWAERGPEAYRLTWTVRCFCPQTTFVDTVEGGEVVEHREAPDSDAFDDPGPKTMETIFGEVQAAIDSDPYSLEVDYDDETGAVRSYFVDEAQNIADEEHGLDVALEVTDPRATPATVELAELTEPYPCGYGFQAGRPDQQVGLFVVRDERASTGTVTLPAEGWRGEIQLGQDLFANWCDDVMEPDEPTPSVDERWPIVAGTLDVTVPDEGQGPATLVATDLVAERPDGTRVELGDITLENEFYGTFAG